MGNPLDYELPHPLLTLYLFLLARDIYCSIDSLFALSVHNYDKFSARAVLHMHRPFDHTPSLDGQHGGSALVGGNGTDHDTKEMSQPVLCVQFILCKVNNIFKLTQY